MFKPKDVAAEIALELLQIKAIQLNPNKPFTWASGWQSPIYCDNRKTLSFPAVRTKIKAALAHLIEKKFPEVKLIAGVATAGIAHGALVADHMGLPFVYVRSKPKGHGLTNQIEGQLVGKEVTVVVEDLVSTGMSSLAAVEALREAGCNVLGLTAIFTYGFQKSVDAFDSESCPFFTLSNYETLIEMAVKHNFVSERQLDALNLWRQHPEEWGVRDFSGS